MSIQTVIKFPTKPKISEEKKRENFVTHLVYREKEEIEKIIKKEYSGLDFQLSDIDISGIRRILSASIYRQMKEQEKG